MPRGLFDRFGRPKRVIAFSGQVYSNSDMASAPGARRFETEPTLLMDAHFLVQDNTQNFGNATTQDLAIAANNWLHLAYVDLSTLYFRNMIPGNNGRVRVIGTRL